jgi:hypothetical protein
MGTDRVHLEVPVSGRRASSMVLTWIVEVDLGKKEGTDRPRKGEIKRRDREIWGKTKQKEIGKEERKEEG